MTTIQKFTVTAATISTIGIMLYSIIPKGIKGIYGNKVSTYITTEAGRKNNVAYLTAQGFNSYCGYGIESQITTNPNAVRDYVLKLRRNNFKEVGLIYSRYSSVTVSLDQYNRNCTNDSMKFTFVVSEIEQYNTGDRIGFYNNIRTVSNYCKEKNISRRVYQGWGNDADIDSIVKYTDCIYLHAYGVYSNYSNAGAWVYGYTKTRLGKYALAAAKYQKNYSVVIIYSTENPDQTKTQFGYRYFLTHKWEDIHTSFVSYYNANATATMKTNLTISGSQIFVEDQAKQIR